MAFEGLAEKLANSFKRLRSKGKLSEADVKEAMREVRLALLEADVNYKVAKDFTNTVTERAVGAEVMESLTPGQMVVKIVDEELTRLRAHIKAFREICTLPEVGRKLDFLVQEFNRECNTVCSKSSDRQITALALAMKNEIEKVREQIQNLE